MIVVRERTVDKGFIDIKQGLNVCCATGWENKKKSEIKTKENRKRTLLSKLPSQSRFGHSLTLRHVPRAPRACFFSRVLFFSHAYTHPRACFTHPRACFFSRIHIRWTCSRLLPWTGHWTLLPPGFAPHPSVRNITLASRLWDLVDGV